VGGGGADVGGGGADVGGGGADVVGTERLQLTESTASEEDPAGHGVHMRG
jgi:hypothetical protein